MQVVYFVIGLLAFLLGFGSFIAFVSAKLSRNISSRVFGLIEKVMIVGILLGAIGMFQPWILGGYRVGFHVVLLSTLAYIVWSHIAPRPASPDEEVTVDTLVSEPTKVPTDGI